MTLCDLFNSIKFESFDFIKLKFTEYGKEHELELASKEMEQVFNWIMSDEFMDKEVQTIDIDNKYSSTSTLIVEVYDNETNDTKTSD